MYKSLIALVVFGAISAPAVAQNAPQMPAAPPAPEAAPAKPKMVKKTVCHRVVIEETTGSRLGSAPKVCKTVEVPAGGAGTSNRAPAPSSDERGSR